MGRYSGGQIMRELLGNWQQKERINYLFVSALKWNSKQNIYGQVKEDIWKQKESQVVGIS